MERATSQAEAVTALLKEFRQTGDAQELLEGLRQLEQETGAGELWLRFFDGDTGATTINDLVKALNALGTSPEDLISIFQTLKHNGSLVAEIELI